MSYILGPRFVRTKFPPHKNDSETSPFRLFHSPAFAPPAELKQASNMLGWEIPPLLEENPTHTYDNVYSDREEYLFDLMGTNHTLARFADGNRMKSST